MVSRILPHRQVRERGGYSASRVDENFETLAECARRSIRILFDDSVLKIKTLSSVLSKRVKIQDLAQTHNMCGITTDQLDNLHLADRFAARVQKFESFLARIKIRSQDRSSGRRILGKAHEAAEPTITAVPLVMPFHPPTASDAVEAE
jgi:hypothetical protein